MKSIILKMQWVVFLCLSAILFSTACSDSPTGDDQLAIIGPYLVDRVNGNSVPFVTETESTEEYCHILNNGGCLDLRSDGQFQMKVHILEEICDGSRKAQYARVMRGIYEVSNGRLDFTPNEDDPSDPFTGDVQENGYGLNVRLDSYSYFFVPMEL